MSIFSQFFTILNQFSKPNKLIFQDSADTFSSSVSVVVLTTAFTIVTTKSYLLSPIACFIPTYPTGINFLNYAENYCWTYGTYPVLQSEAFPQHRKDWNSLKYKINYYQWIPFVLFVQTILFYLPKLLWTTLSSNLDNFQFLKTEELKKESDYIDSRSLLLDMIIEDNSTHFQSLHVLKKRKNKYCSSLISNKRKLIYGYIFVKFLYLFNSVLQLLLIQKLFGYDNSTTFWTYFKHYFANYDTWDGGVYFPRLSYCTIDPIKGVGTTQTYMAQCILSCNMLNEKIYVFLWLWMILVCFITLVSIKWWFIDLIFLPRKKVLIFDCLRKHNEIENKITNSFLINFLKVDGVFMLLLLKEGICYESWRNLVNDLFKLYMLQQRNIHFVVTNGKYLENEKSNTCYV